LFFLLLIVCAHPAIVSAENNNNNKNARMAKVDAQAPAQKSQLDNTPISGQFTINQNEPTGGINFNSFNDLKDRLVATGVNGPVMVDVVGNNAVYEEQLTFLSVPGASQTNTITINGNGNILQFLSTNSNERATLKLNGAKFFTFNNLIIKALGELSGEYG